MGKSPILAVAVLLSLANGLSAAVTLNITNPSFEVNPKSDTTRFDSNGYQKYAGAITGWTGSTFSQVGINTNSGPFNTGTPPDGTQCAFIQSNGGTISLSQAIAEFDRAFTYTLTFWESERTSNRYSNFSDGITPSLSVTLGSQTIVPAQNPPSVNTSTWTVTNGNFYQIVSATFMVPANGSYTLSFNNRVGAGNDWTTSIDAISITGVPEPASLSLLALGGLALLRRRRR